MLLSFVALQQRWLKIDFDHKQLQIEDVVVVTGQFLLISRNQN